MSTQSSFLAWLRHPASVVLIIAVVLMAVIMSEQSQQARLIPAAVNQPPVPPVPANTPPVNKGGELPRIVRQLSAPPMSAAGAGGAATKAPATAGRLQAPDLGSLLGRLEEKVKAEPDNMGNRLLLAQTYNELGLGDKALQEARAARKRDPAHARAKLVLAAILSTRDDQAGLKEAQALLNELKTESQIKQYLVEMYLGDVLIRLGDHAAAKRHWQQALDDMPVTDNRRAGIEKRVADLSAKTS